MFTTTFFQTHAHQLPAFVGRGVRASGVLESKLAGGMQENLAEIYANRGGGG